MSVTKWINARLEVALDEPSLAEIKDFSLIWNVFENCVCNNNFSIAGVQQRITERDFNADDFKDHLQYFQNRYTSDGHTNERFEFLPILQIQLFPAAPIFSINQLY